MAAVVTIAVGASFVGSSVNFGAIGDFLFGFLLGVISP